MAKAGKLKGVESLEALRASLPPGPQEAPVVGVVVPAPGVPSLREQMDSPEGRHLVMMAALGQSILHSDPLPRGDPPPPVQGKKSVSIQFDDLREAIDEGQLVGELLEWLAARGYIGKFDCAYFQQKFFDERQK